MPQDTVTNKPAVAFPGLVADSRGMRAQSFVQGEASAEVAFGLGVVANAVDGEAVLPAAAADGAKFLGVAKHSHHYQIPNELGLIGIKPDVVMDVVDNCVVWVKIDENVTPTSAVRMRTSAAGGGAGCFRASAVGGATSNLSAFCRWDGTFLAADGYGRLIVGGSEHRTGATAD